MRNELNELFMDQYEERANIIKCIATEIQFYINYRKNNDFDYELFQYVFYDCVQVLENWVGYTSVGVEKNIIIKNAFQCFFLNFYKMLLYFKNESQEPVENELAYKTLYQGKLFRYLGTSINSECKASINVEYNDIYVSWSKKEYLPYMETKLHSNFIIISCDVKTPFFGIDLHNLGIGKDFEKEVVFPTIKKLMCNKL